jgi:hypothetical protein
LDLEPTSRDVAVPRRVKVLVEVVSVLQTEDPEQAEELLRDIIDHGMNNLSKRTERLAFGHLIRELEDQSPALCGKAKLRGARLDRGKTIGSRM